jgi:hypothetical protein
MGEWLSVYRHNRWVCFFSLLVVDVLLFSPFVVFYALAFFSGDPIIVSPFSSSDILMVFLLGGLFLLTLYYPISLIYNRNVDGLSYEGVICSSTFHLIKGMTLYVSEEMDDRSEAIETPSCYHRWCSNAVGSQVRFHLSRSGKAIIDEILD